MPQPQINLSGLGLRPTQAEILRGRQLQNIQPSMTSGGAFPMPSSQQALRQSAYQSPVSSQGLSNPQRELLRLQAQQQVNEQIRGTTGGVVGMLGRAVRGIGRERKVDEAYQDLLKEAELKAQLPTELADAELMQMQTPQGPKTLRVDKKGRAFDPFTFEPVNVSSFQLEAPETASLDTVQVFPSSGDPFTAMTDDQGNFFDMTGQPVQLGATDRVIEGSTLSGTPEQQGLTRSEIAEMDEAEINTINFSDTVDDALAMLQEVPDVNTFVAQGAAFINDLQREIGALGRTLGADFNESLLDPSEHAEDFDSMGINNRRMQSLVIDLAYARALAKNPDGRISEPDFRAAVRSIGASAGDPRAFSQVLRDVKDRTIRSFETRYRIKTDQDYTGELLNRRQTDTELPEGWSVEIN